MLVLLGFWVPTRLILSLPLDWDFLPMLPMRSLEFTMRSQQKFCLCGSGVVPGQQSKVNGQRQDTTWSYVNSICAVTAHFEKLLNSKRSLVDIVCRGAYQFRSNSISSLSWIKVASIAGSFGTSIALLIVLVLIMEEVQHARGAKRPATVVTSSGTVVCHPSSYGSLYGWSSSTTTNSRPTLRKQIYLLWQIKQ